MTTVTVEPSVKLYYEDYGQGQTFVFIHGGGLSHEMWEQQVFALADNYRTIAYDQRSHGQSSKPGHGHNFERLCDDLEILLAYCQVDRPVLVCHGIGAYVGLTYALRHPSQLTGLVLTGAGARFLEADGQRGGFAQDQWLAYMQAMARNKVEAVTQLVNNGFYYQDPGPETRQAVITTMLQWPIYATKQLGNALQSTDLGKRVSALNVATLIAHGIHDLKQPYEGAQKLSKALPTATLVPFKNSAHNPQLEEYDAFNQMLIRFVSEQAAR
ncbi:MAG TPA: alpha/beta hydrolase [Burkholderiaceae bacterium]|nr:alpha/beta hydrolase [Burkholderiaceae bacterium]